MIYRDNERLRRYRNIIASCDNRQWLARRMEFLNIAAEHHAIVVSRGSVKVGLIIFHRHTFAIKPLISPAINPRHIEELLMGVLTPTIAALAIAGISQQG